MLLKKVKVTFHLPEPDKHLSNIPHFTHYNRILHAYSGDTKFGHV